MQVVITCEVHNLVLFQNEGQVTFQLLLYIVRKSWYGRC